MPADEMYNEFTPQISSERLRCQEILYEYNYTRPNEANRRDEIIRKLFGEIGANSCIEIPLRCDYGFNVYWGENSFCEF